MVVFSAATIVIALQSSVPPPLASEFSPPAVSYAVRNIARCPSGDVVSAEFSWQRGTSTVIGITGSGHAASPAEKQSINERLKRLGQFSYVSISCNGPGRSIIVVHGVPGMNPKYGEVTISWERRGFQIF